MRRLPRRHGDDGLSLAELLVVLMVFGVMVAVIGGAVISSMQTSRRTDARADATAALRTTLEQVSRELRVADPVRSGSATAVTVDVKRPDTATTSRCYRVTYAVDTAARTLVETRQAYAAATLPAVPSCTTASGTATSRTLLRNVDLAQSGFTYQLADGTTPASVTAAQRVARVTVTGAQALPQGGSIRLSTQSQVRNSKR